MIEVVIDILAIVLCGFFFGLICGSKKLRKFLFSLIVKLN